MPTTGVKRKTQRKLHVLRRSDIKAFLDITGKYDLGYGRVRLSDLENDEVMELNNLCDYAMRKFYRG